jgi:glycosyltransferase involved in cell wall biosynthesis
VASPRVDPGYVDVLRGRDIVCFGSDWAGDPLSRTHLMHLLARDNRILWVNSIGYRAPRVSRADLGRLISKALAATRPLASPEPGIVVLNPLAVPVYGSESVRALNRFLLRAQVRRAMLALGFKRPVSWVSNPAAAVVAGSLGEDLVVYHCADEYSAFPGASPTALAELERRLLDRADAVFVPGALLLESKSRVNPRTFFVPHGVDHAHFRRALDPATTIPDDAARLPRPVLGFFGLVADWVDLELLEYVAECFSEGSVVLLGKATTDVRRLARRPNVHLLGRKPYDDLPRYCKGFDVALVPFRIDALTLHANPLKVREYLAAGLPVVSTDIPEVASLGLCRISGDREGFVREIRAALEAPGPRAERSDAMRAETWEARLDDIRAHLGRLEDANTGTDRPLRRGPTRS